MKTLEKYSFGIGDRFTKQGDAQLRAIIKANKNGIPLVPVWNKSNREHQIVNTVPSDTWKEALSATRKEAYTGNWYVDADHINMQNVERYMDHSNFFTIDVADAIGAECDAAEWGEMFSALLPFSGQLDIPGIDETFEVSKDMLEGTVKKFYPAIKEAALIYRSIKDVRGADNFVAEISMDEVEDPQTPPELFFILLMVQKFEIPVQTIAPKFTGRFNKGVDYVGDVEQFRKEFEQDLMVIDHVINSFDLPSNLKLSVHSGSDKFSIYPVIGALIKKHDKGIHIKTAGTTWLEEVIGLSMAGDDALEMAKSFYHKAYDRMEELCAPYATVIDIDPDKLPKPAEVVDWSSERFASTLRHIPGHQHYDPMFRQLIHVGYKVAAEAGDAYLDMLKKYSEIVGEQVEENIYERHIMRLFAID